MILNAIYLRNIWLSLALMPQAFYLAGKILAEYIWCIIENEWIEKVVLPCSMSKNTWALVGTSSSSNWQNLRAVLDIGLLSVLLCLQRLSTEIYKQTWKNASQAKM